MTRPLPTLYRCCFFIRLSLIALSLCLLTTSCATSSKPPADEAPDLNRAVIAKGQPPSGNVEQRILEEYQRWRGTRHELGGSDRDGIDCSGFVKAVYRDAFNIRLPRTTAAQVRAGKPVALTSLQPGDLVFFTPPSYPRHVGIFLSHSQFVHASKTKGVTISKIDEYYWRKYYWTARRVLPASPTP